MAAGDLVQQGTTVAVGFDSLEYGTCLMQVARAEPVADVNTVHDKRAAQVTKIYTNPGQKLTLEGVMLSADLTAVKALIIGSVVTVNSLKYEVIAVPRVHGSGPTTVTLELERRDSWTAGGMPLA
jgi:hypothetical protein